MCVAAGPVRPCLAIFAGGVVATPESLILSADEMGVEREEAVHVLVDMATQITEQWRSRIADGMAATSVDQLSGAFRLAVAVRGFDFAQVASPVRSCRYRPGRAAGMRGRTALWKRIIGYPVSDIAIILVVIDQFTNICPRYQPPFNST